MEPEKLLVMAVIVVYVWLITRDASNREGERLE